MTWVLVVLGWAGWCVALATTCALRRRTALVADVEHELRGAATAIGMAAEASRDEGLAGPLVRLQIDRMNAALADLARARGAEPAATADLEAGRLAQVLANVSANAAEHGLGEVRVSGGREGRVLRLEVSNESAAEGVRGEAAERGRASEGPRERAGRGRGLRIAKRAARELGGRVRLKRSGGVVRAVIELPADGERHASEPSVGEDAAHGADRDDQRAA